MGLLMLFQNNKSLLPAGILSIKGRFDRGDVISVVNTAHIKIAIGVIAYNSNDAKKNYWKK